MSYPGPLNNRSNGDRGREWGRGRGWGHGRGSVFNERASGMIRSGPLRVNTRAPPQRIAKSFSRARDIVVRNDLFHDSMAAAGLVGSEPGTKLYISNLDFGVSNDDIKELFSEIGPLRRSMVHYDSGGHPSGSAEVVFLRRSDAIAALKRYNNVQLDGKAMKIEIIGDSLDLPVSARINVGRRIGRESRTVVMMPKLVQGGSSLFKRVSRPNPGTFQRGRGGFQASRGRGQGRGRGQSRGRGRGGARGRGRGQRQFNDKSADDLDKELDEYHTEAMNIS